MPDRSPVASLPALAALPGLVHGFEQRVGSSETDRERRRRIEASLASAGRLLLLRQVHGTTVVAAPWLGAPEADAATADRPGLILGVQTADCLPALIVDPRRRVVAAVHAGWRGTAAGVLRETLKALAALGCRAPDLRVALGPAIGVCCYEVGEDVRSAFGAAGERFFKDAAGRGPHLDLRQANLTQLGEWGVSPDRISQVQDCTACRPDLYPSYRRDGKNCGRILSYVGWALPKP